MTLCSAIVGFALLIAASPAAAARAASPAAPRVTAAHAIVIDADTGDILFAKSADAEAPPASLTKLFTAAVALEAVPLDQPMTVQPGDLVGEASMGLRAGEQLSFDALLHGMLLASGNDAATTVAQNVGQLAGDSTRQAVGRFMDRANARLAQLGPTGTQLKNPHGLDEDGQYSTARDIAALTAFALATEPAFATTIGEATYRGGGHTVEQTNELLGRYPGLIGGKTGFTAKAGYCLMEVAQRGGQRVIVVLLGSTAAAWYADATALLDYGFAALATPGAARRGRVTLGAQTLTAIAPAGAAARMDVLSAPGGAVVSTGARSDPRAPWRWLGVALLLAIAGLVGLTRAPRRGRAPRRAPAARQNAPASRDNPVEWSTQPFQATSPQPATPPATASAWALASRGVALASAEDFGEAAGAFYRAAQLDARLDLTRVPGFWALCPRGHSAAAAALVKAGRLADARSLAVVLGLERRAPASIGD